MLKAGNIKGFLTVPLNDVACGGRQNQEVAVPEHWFSRKLGQWLRLKTVHM